MKHTTFGLVAISLWSLAACGPGDDTTQRTWQVVGRNLPSALLSVWGSSATDVYTVGSDAGDGLGPAVFHWDGATWTRLSTGAGGNLWWVYGFENGPVFMGGEALALKYENGTFTTLTTPGTETIFGLWGSSPTDMWAVGGAIGGANGAFAWRLQGDVFVPAAGFPSDLAANSAMWKIYGRSANDAWIVGTNGKTVHWDGAALTEVSAGVGESLFTVHANSKRYVAVGGFGTGLILENETGTWTNATPPGAPGFVGVSMTENGGYAVGADGTVYSRGDSGWVEEKLGFNVDETFHSVWNDPDGGVWIAGGQVQVAPLKDGIMLYSGTETLGGL